MNKHSTINVKKIPLSNQACDQIATLTLNRPDAANAFNAAMMLEITDALTSLEKEKNLRCLIIKANGKHFSAGADLNWMKDAKNLTNEENKQETLKLANLFEALYNFPLPVICVVNGATFGGAVGLVSCCDVAIALSDAKFCLSEVKIGLLPAVILPYLKRKMLAGPLRRLSLSAQLFKAEEAKNVGLVDDVCTNEALPNMIYDLVNQLLQASPQAQSALKKLQRQIDANGGETGEFVVEAIAAARASQDGQAGLQAFFDKKQPPWSYKIPMDDVASLLD